MAPELKKLIDHRLQRIANVLLLNSSFINNLGLCNGKMGITIFFYSYAKYTGNKIYKEYANELIDEIYEEANTELPIDLANGLTGIGWGIEYLVQNGFIEGEVDIILNEIDEAAYRRLLIQPSCNELNDIMLYHLIRIKSKTYKYDNPKSHVLTHNILCLLGECEKLIVYRDFKENTSFINPIFLATICSFLSEISKIQLFQSKANELLKYISSFEKISGLNDKKATNNLVDDAILIAWEQLIYGVDKKEGININELFLKMFEFLKDEENWNEFLDKLYINNSYLSEKLTGIAIALLQLKVNFQQSEYSFTLIENEQIKQPENKLSVFIFKSDTRGMQYGIGTYINQLVNAFDVHSDLSIFYIHFYSNEYKEIRYIKESPNLVKIYIPTPINKTYSNRYIDKYAARVVGILSEIIEDLKQVVFQVSSVESLPIVKLLKTRFTYPVISVIQSAQWQILYNGNKKKFIETWDNLENINPTNGILKERELYQISDYIISVTRYMKNYIMDYFGISSDKISIIPNGINVSNFKILSPQDKIKQKEQFGFGEDEKIILFSGRLDKCKGISFLLSAFAEALQKNDRLRLVLIGEGDFSTAFNGSINICGKVTFTGFINFEHLLKFYQIADVGVVPSIYDHGPFVALEMMAHNIPLIISNTEGLNEMITDESQNIFISPLIDSYGEMAFNVNEFADAIIQIVDDNSEFSKNRISKPLSQNFLASQMAQQTHDIYYKLLSLTYSNN